MKRCPTCNQQYTDEWLTFCTQDGTSLVEAQPSTSEPPPTLVRPPMPPSVSPSEQPTLDMPGSYRAPPVPFGQPQPIQSGWTPPPPPAYPTGPDQNLAVASLIVGIASISVGWCCSLGMLLGPIAIVLGIISLVQIKNNPGKYTGKGMAIGGIVTGSLYFVFLVLLVLLYGMAFLSGAFR